VAKTKTIYVCQECGTNSSRWVGKCEACGAWNSYLEETATVSPRDKGRRPKASAQSSPITEISAIDDQRLSTGIGEFDRVVGGGIVGGSVTLIGGDPGIGKSTLMMQLCRHVCEDEKAGHTVLYVSGEESLRQLRMRADRLSALSDRFIVHAETDIDLIIEECGKVNPSIVIIDSIQTMFRSAMESTPGSVSQLRESTAALIQHAKSTGIPVLIIGHVTKEGVIAGPRVLEHMVDTVLQFEGDSHHAYRMVRCIKNRYGSTNEIGIFEMTAKGMREVLNPSEVFLSGRTQSIAGSCVCPIIEGSRALLIEVQSLVSPSNYGVAQRTITGIDSKRHALLLAVLEKRHGIQLGKFDVFTNIAGGVKIDETAADLAIAMAVVSSSKDMSVDQGTVFIGEVGLGGEVRSVNNIEKRVSEAEKLGFNTVVIPKNNLGENGKWKVKIVEVASILEAVNAVFPF
jgi:DNA repair protein RadA/Sms